MVMLPALLSLIVQAATAAPPPQPDASSQPMMTYQMVFLRQGRPQPTSPETEKMQAAHLAFLAKLNKDRVNLLYGPFQDDKDPRGIAVLDVKDADAAKQLLAEEPYVKAGYLTLEVKPWMGPRGWFHAPSEPPTPEPLVFGLLMSGPNRSPSSSEARRIQEGHLAYMEELAKQGKLVMAGPFVDDSPTRGVVVYRGVTVEQAKELAAGDPAVKAGRLVIEARPWMTFKGMLK